MRAGVGGRLTRRALGVGAAVAIIALVVRDRGNNPAPEVARRMPEVPPRSFAPEPETCGHGPLAGDGCEGDLDRPLQLPNGTPSALACDDARQIVAQARQ